MFALIAINVALREGARGATGRDYPKPYVDLGTFREYDCQMPPARGGFFGFSFGGDPGDVRIRVVD
jgi:hypothetical protein